ncbi:MAG: hypothetical protein HY548_04555 [Elusimicrobia bacterium]|nr:hypothetical protein [Elusimicrobiota bacterium]
MRKQCALVAALVLVGGLALWGCKNNNLFGTFHEKGTGDSAALLSDAKSALAKREFNNAKAYYESLISKEPRNSEALYGAATATMGTAGLDLGTLLSNVITSKQSAPAARGIPGVIEYASIGALGTASSVDSNSILNSLNLSALRGNINKIVCYLLKIRTGSGDGVIPHDNVNVMISLSITRALRAALRMVDSGLVDLRKTSNGKNFDVVVTGTVATLNNACVDGGAMELAADDFIGAVESFTSAFNKVNPGDGSTIKEMKEDLKNAFAELKSELNTAGATNCVTLLSKAKYDTTNLTPPTQDPGDCLTLGSCCQ